MTSVHYQDNVVRKSIFGRLIKVVILLLISLGLYLFAIAFPIYVLFKPQSVGWILWISYANNLILPFAFYFFLCLGERWLKTWHVRALIAFAIPILLEFGQLFYYRFSTGRYVGSFDPLDIVMDIIGVGLAVLIERRVFAKLFKNW
jgi:glycopeptide antibiotics resistance protein